MEAFSRQLSRIEKSLGSTPLQEQPLDVRSLSFETLATDPYIKHMISELTKNRRILGVNAERVGAKTILNVAIGSNLQPVEMPPFRSWIQAVIDKHDDVPF